jgi:hypothetical protein
MKISQRFNQTKQMISEGIRKDSMSMKLLELQLLSSDELKETGFVFRAVDFILNPKEISENDIHEFFDKICVDLKMDEIEVSGLPVIAETPGGFVFGFKMDIVRGFLHRQMFIFIQNEKIKTNNGKINSRRYEY